MNNLDYVKLSATQYLFLKPEYLTSGSMFEIKEQTPHVSFDLHAISKTESVINTKVDDTDMGQMYGVIGYFTSQNVKDLTGCIVLIQSDEQEKYKNKCSLQLVLFENKSTRGKIGKINRINDVSQSVFLDGSLDNLSLVIYSRPHFILPGSQGRPSLNNIAQLWKNNFLGVRAMLGNAIDLPKIMKRKHVAFMTTKSASSVIEQGTLETISFKQQGGRDVKRLKSLQREATTISYVDIDRSKESSKKTMNLREEAFSLVDGAFAQNWSPEDFVRGFLKLKHSGISQDQLAGVSATMLMDASYRITDPTTIKEDLIEEVSIDIDQVKDTPISYKLITNFISLTGVYTSPHIFRRLY